MTDSDPHALNTWLRHIYVLAEDIGPRGSTSEEERQAADYCRQTLSDLGLAPRIETFQSATTLFGLHVVVAAGMLLSFFVYPLAGRIGAMLALALAVLCMSSQSLELLFRDNPIRRLLPRAGSQNVVATIPPLGEHRRDVILMGHLDTNHAGFIFRSTSTVNAWRIFSSICAFTCYVQIIFYGVGLLTQWPLIWPWLTLPAAINALIFGAVMLEAELAPLSKGANDNATGAGLVLVLGEQLAGTTLEHTRVWLVCTGCEEVKHYGAADFYERHRDELVNPQAIVFEMLGRDGPGYLLRESTINLFTIRASVEMVNLAASVAHQHPHLGAHPTRVEGGHTEMADAIRAGVPAITIAGIDEGGVCFNYDGPHLYWHHKDDVPANLIPNALERNHAFVWELVQAIDAQDAAHHEQDDLKGVAHLPGIIEPHVLFPAGTGLVESRYPKANPQAVQSTSVEHVPQVKDD